MLNSFKIVFGHLKYVCLAIVITFSYLLVAIMIPSFSVLKLYWLSDISVISLSKIILDYFISNSTILARTLLGFISLLSGLNFAMLVFYLKKRIRIQKNLDTGFIGMFTGFLGIGCASCGSIILSSILGLTVATSFFKSIAF